MSERPEIEAVNQVLVVGRLTAPAEGRELPSGDQLVTWRLVVDRPPDRRRAQGTGRPVTVDTLECVAWTARLQRAAASWSEGDVIAVEGALRRRWWRSPQGVASRYEIEAAVAKRVAKAADAA